MVKLKFQGLGGRRDFLEHLAQTWIPLSSDPIVVRAEMNEHRDSAIITASQ
jgi:hypothetical protein